MKRDNASSIRGGRDGGGAHRWGRKQVESTSKVCESGISWMGQGVGKQSPTIVRNGQGGG